MNFKETLQFCTKNIMQGWVNTIPNMTGTYLQLNPLTFTLFFLTNLIPTVISRALVDFPLRPEEGVDNSRWKITPIESSQNKADYLIVDYLPQQTIFDNNTTTKAPLTPTQTLNLICTQAEKFLCYFAGHGANIIFKDITPYGRLYTSSDNHPTLTRFEYQIFENQLSNVSAACNKLAFEAINPETLISIACKWTKDVCDHLVIKEFESLACNSSGIVSDGRGLDVVDMHSEQFHHFMHSDNFRVINPINSAIELCGNSNYEI